MNTSRERPSQGSRQPAPRRTLKLIGYWAPLPRWSQTPSPYAEEEPPWPDIRRAVRAGWRSAEREQLVAYLRSGHRCSGALGFSACRFECRVTYSILGSGEMTDGEWVWPEGLPHYVERHGVMLPEEFVASAAARGWRVPPVDRVGTLVPAALIDRALRSGDTALAARIDKSIGEGGCQVDDSAWLEWAKRLPEVPAVPSPPDPGRWEDSAWCFNAPTRVFPASRWMALTTCGTRWESSTEGTRRTWGMNESLNGFRSSTARRS